MKRKWWHVDPGHMRSQKFAGLVFCVFVLFIAAFRMKDAAFGNLALAVTGLYTAFVGGRAWSDGQSLRYGGGINTSDNDREVSVVRRMKRTVEVEEKQKKDKDDEID